jgi:hypothetical protein
MEVGFALSHLLTATPAGGEFLWIIVAIPIPVCLYDLHCCPFSLQTLEGFHPTPEPEPEPEPEQEPEHTTRSSGHSMQGSPPQGHHLKGSVLHLSYLAAAQSAHHLYEPPSLGETDPSRSCIYSVRKDLLSQLAHRGLHIWPHPGFHSYPTASALFISEISIVAVLILVSIRHLHLIPSIHLIYSTSISSHLHLHLHLSHQEILFPHLEHAISACISSTITPVSPKPSSGAGLPTHVKPLPASH